MPVVHSGQPLPTWCELQHYEIVRLEPGSSHRFERIAPKEKLIVGHGQCQLRRGAERIVVSEKANLDLKADDDPFEIVTVELPTTLIYMAGMWGDEVGGSGLFSVVHSPEPHDNGDPVNYPKVTNFDAHYHDCDEYWILFEGSGTAVTEGQAYGVVVGDCVVTGMGHHHDFPQVDSLVRAVYFETTLEGRKRLGHLWDHTHGPAQPKPERT